MRSARFLAAISLLIAGCPTLPEPILCGRIPDGGCPAGRGGSCEDAACAGLYDCVDGNWVRVEVCSLDGGVPSPSNDGGVDHDAGACTPVGIDTSNEAFGCSPDLQEPDCPAAAAAGCKETVCFTGCGDFFFCTKDGWKDVGYCTEDGDFVPLP